MEIKHKNITDRIIRAFYNVYNTLGFGFLEKVYENSMLLELTEIGLSVQKQYPIDVYYKEKLVHHSLRPSDYEQEESLLAYE